MSESKQFLNIIRIFDPDQQTELIEIMKQYNFDEIIDRCHTNARNTDGFWGSFVYAAEYAGNAPAHCLRDQRRTSEKPPVGRLFPAYSPAAGVRLFLL